MDKLENWGSKFALVTLAAKRAKQLKGGARPLVDTDSRNPLTIALEEIAAGKVTCVVSDADIVISAHVEPEVAELLAIPVETEVKAEVQAEELLAVPAEAASAVEEEEAEKKEEGAEAEPEEAEEEEDEEEEEPDVWHAALDGELASEEHPLGHDEEIQPDVEPDISGLAESSIEEAEPKPKAKRGRKARKSDDVDLAIESPLVEADAEESEEDTD